MVEDISSSTSNLKKRKSNDLQHETKGTSKRNSRSPASNGTSSKYSQQNGLHENNLTGIKRLWNIFDPTEIESLRSFILVRVAAVLIWSGGILYASYHVFQACEEHLDVWYKDPVMNPGSLSTLLGRGRDSTDYEWEMFTTLFGIQLWFWYTAFVIMSGIVQPAYPQYWKFISTAVSLAMFWSITGFLPAVCILLQPVIYWMIAHTRSKLLAWTVTVLFIFNLNSPIVYIFLPTDRLGEYFFVITAAWNYARCISFCYDIWEQTGADGSEINFNHLGNGIRYCLYLPLAISGPLVTYESFEKNIINKPIEKIKRTNLSEDFKIFGKQMLRMAVNVVLIELILHLLYFRALSMVTTVHRHLSLWAICGTIYWLGQFFSLKYKVLYGIPTYIAEFDGMEMPPLPACPSYLHRYSVLWRDFDRGLYRFLVKYIYVPTLAFVKSSASTKNIPADVQKLMASFMTFVYVYIWHSLSFEVFVWAVLNFLGITIERIGSSIKKEIDNRVQIPAIVWDFWIEPLVTIPLAAMSILNSSIFCGSIQAATSFSIELWKRRQGNWVLLFIYCLTHTAVTWRTWRHKLLRLVKEWPQIQNGT